MQKSFTEYCAVYSNSLHMRIPSPTQQRQPLSITFNSVSFPALMNLRSFVSGDLSIFNIHIHTHTPPYWFVVVHAILNGRWNVVDILCDGNISLRKQKRKISFV